MKKERPSLDGFIPRRASANLGEHHATSHKEPIIAKRQQLHAGNELAEDLAERPTRTSLGTSRIRESLEAIGSEAEEDKPRSRREKRRQRKERRKSSKKRRIIKLILLVLGLVILSVGGFLAYKFFSNVDSVFQGNIFGLTKQDPLRQDNNGRTNVLIFGTSEDDPGHEAAWLTDSIIVLSIDQTNKNAFMFNIPRDLEVEYGAACPEGYQGKINSLYGCFYEDGNNEEAGAQALMSKVGAITGLDMHYYTHVNYGVVRDAVAAVGDIKITIESDDPRGVMDANFDWKCGVTGLTTYRTEAQKAKCPPSGHFIDYPNGEVTLDAEHALYLAQARGADPLGNTYGLANANFDREKNQQKIIKAFREKALAAGTLANIGKVTNLLDAFGKNLRTNFQTSEVSTLVALARDIQSDNIVSIPLFESDNEDTPLSADGNPKLGAFQYSALQSYIKRQLSSEKYVREAAGIIVLNGTNTAGVAGKEAGLLEEDGYTVSDIGDAPGEGYAAVEVYKIGEGNAATTTALEKRYGVTVKTTDPPVEAAEGTAFIIVIGQVRE